MYFGSSVEICALGWLSPSGEFYQTEYHEHLAKAEELAEKIYQYDKRYAPDEELMNHGWVHITENLLGIWPELRIMFYGHLTQAQKDYLKPIVEEHWKWISPSWKSDLNEELELGYEVDWRH